MTNPITITLDKAHWATLANGWNMMMEDLHKCLKGHPFTDEEKKIIAMAVLTTKAAFIEFAHAITAAGVTPQDDHRLKPGYDPEAEIKRLKNAKDTDPPQETLPGFPLS